MSKTRRPRTPGVTTFQREVKMKSLETVTKGDEGGEVEDEDENDVDQDYRNQKIQDQLKRWDDKSAEKDGDDYDNDDDDEAKMKMIVAARQR